MALLHQLWGQGEWAGQPLPADPVLVQLHQFAGRVHLVSPRGQQVPPEKLGRGAAVAGVDILPEGHDVDVLLGQVLNGYALRPPSLRLNLSRKATTRVSPGWARAPSVPASRSPSGS